MSGRVAAYSFVTRWFVEAPIERVHDAIRDVCSWPRWWTSVVAVDVLETGDEHGVGQVTRTTWRGALPYAIRFDARVTKSLAPVELEVEATGGLAGRGRWELAREGAGTRVTYHWEVTTTQAWMNLAAPLLRPAFRWNHDGVMRWGAEGLARHLGVGVVDRSRE